MNGRPDRAQADIRFVFYNGRRVELADYDEGSLIAAIRRDQPWVDRIIPKIGDHIPQPWVGPEASRGTATVNAAIAGDRESFMEESIVVVEEPRVVIESVNYLAINVADLAKAERLLQRALRVAGRGPHQIRRSGWLSPALSRLRSPGCVMTDEQADDSFLRNGALLIALHRVGRGARLERS